MIIPIYGLLTIDQVRAIRARLEASNDWVDGRETAGHQGLAVKHNRQLSEVSPVARELGDVILSVLERHPLFISAALPDKVYPPLFNRYEAGMTFGDHVDGAIRLLPGSGLKIRTDLSATVFLSAPEDYEGGELLIEGTYGAQSVKLSAGDLIIYPARSIHRVNPVSQGVRLASFFWIQSLVRDDAARELLFDLDTAIQRLDATNGDAQARLRLTGCYHNLLRMWGTH